jgi:hypothetical protein
LGEKGRPPLNPMWGAGVSTYGHKGPGGGLSSQEVSLQVFSLLARFTGVFGMGTRGTMPPCHQGCQRVLVIAHKPFENCVVNRMKNHQALGLVL